MCVQCVCNANTYARACEYISQSPAKHAVVTAYREIELYAFSRCKVVQDIVLDSHRLSHVVFALLRHLLAARCLIFRSETVHGAKFANLEHTIKYDYVIDRNKYLKRAILTCIYVPMT